MIAFQRISTTALFVLSAAYLSWGFLELTSTGEPGDLQKRHLETRYVERGIDPYEVNTSSVSPQFAIDKAADRVTFPIAPDLGPLPVRTSYPPHAYSLFRALIPFESYTANRWWFAALNLGALIALAGWAYRLLLPLGRSHAQLAAASALAVFANALCLRWGNLSILVTAGVVGSCVATPPGRWASQGALHALALLKPQMAGLSALVLLWRRRPALVVSAALVMALSLATWASVGTDPIAMARKMLGATGTLEVGHRFGVLDFLRNWGVESRTVLAWSTPLALAGMLALLRLRPDLDLLTLTAAALTINRLATYNIRYNDMALVLLLLALLRRSALEARLAPAAAFWLVGLTLWIPTTQALEQSAAVYYLRAAVWLGGLFVMLHRPAANPVAAPAGT